MPTPTHTRASPRRRSREFALQGLYQRQLSGNAPAAIHAQLAEAGGPAPLIATAGAFPEGQGNDPRSNRL